MTTETTIDSPKKKKRKKKSWEEKRADYKQDRKRHFPYIEDADLWIGVDEKGTGFSMVPRTMPIIGAIMDDLSKGKPISATFFALWCRDFYETKFLTINDPNIYAIESKFYSDRKISTWKKRMRILKEYGFIKSQGGVYDDEFSYIIIMNPYIAIKKLFEDGKIVDEEKYEALRDRARDIQAEEANILFKPQIKIV